VKEATVEAAQLGIELIENLQQLVVSGELVDTTKRVQKEAGCSEAEKGNIDSLNTTNIIEVGSSNTSASLSTSTSTSSNIDDIPLNGVYANLQNGLSLSSSTKHQKNPNNDTFVPMYPSVEERIHDMQQRRINACVRLPADHPLQPPMIEPL